ncbi:ABC-2 family transporter [Barrientosiimonas humi]|uniref:ABC-2 family transporter n=2 Tax=Barrientosiimonas TaxID=1535207 RepID=A0A542X9E1_9MICO|nr:MULTISPECIES: ABC transporter permease subunit [Barrientosiimonas]TQL32448.1 ABC-2 family transporter [Barrientosiimonas humi]CAG7572439.1 hypothetical protein BH39T_PBIAJDOK_01054 [Barrientosiimonas humi]
MGAAIKSEIRKVFTTRMWWAMAIGMGLMAGLLSLMFASLLGSQNATDPNDPGAGNPFARMTPGTAQIIYSAGIQFSLTTLVPLALGVMLITNEYRHKTISSTFLATPNRWVVLISKMIALVPLGVVFGVVHNVASVGLASLVIKSKGEPLLLGDPEVLKTMALVVLANTVWMLLGFGFGMLVRNQVAAVMSAVGAAFVLHIALNLFFSARGWETAAKFLPGNLTSGMLVTSDPMAGQQTTSGAASPYFNWWQSSLTLLAYAVVLAGIGAFLTTRRDVS